jgi:hypothetical protein
MTNEVELKVYNNIVNKEMLSLFKTLIDQHFVAQETGKGLSANDFTNALKTKLDGIAEGANKYTLPTATNKVIGGVTTTSQVATVTTAMIAVPIINGVPYYENTTYAEATSNNAGLMSANDKKKLDGVAANAQVNVLEGVQVNGKDVTITSKKVNIDLSNYATLSTNQALTNKTYNGFTLAAACAKGVSTTVTASDANLITSGAVASELTKYAKTSDISTVYRVKGSVETYADLPESPTVGDVYNVKTADATHNVNAGDNLVWSSDKVWDNLSGIVDTSSFATKEELKNAVSITIVSEADIRAMFA